MVADLLDSPVSHETRRFSISQYQARRLVADQMQLKGNGANDWFFSDARELAAFHRKVELVLGVVIEHASPASQKVPFIPNSNQWWTVASKPEVTVQPGMKARFILPPQDGEIGTVTGVGKDVVEIQMPDGSKWVPFASDVEVLVTI